MKFNSKPHYAKWPWHLTFSLTLGNLPLQQEEVDCHDDGPPHGQQMEGYGHDEQCCEPPTHKVPQNLQYKTHFRWQ